jgi:DNA-binding transcriptional regulator YiaG
LRPGRHSRPRRPWHLSPDGFRELRASCLLSRKACAGLLGCSVRTVRAWDAGARRVPWSVVRLLRILRRGELPAKAWAGWRVWDDRLIAPTVRRSSWGICLGGRSRVGRPSAGGRTAPVSGPQARATGRSVPEPPTALGRSLRPLASFRQGRPLGQALPCPLLLVLSARLRRWMGAVLRCRSSARSARGRRGACPLLNNVNANGGK